VTTTLVASSLALQADSGPLQITVHLPQSIVAGENFNLPLTAQGGFAPYIWSGIAGDLPPGLKLYSHRGVISGAPTNPGEYHFKLGVVDSTVPQQQQAQRDLTIIVIAGLTIDWKQPPQVQGNTLAGSVVVSNQTQHGLDITLIVVAVNSIGRSTALGYQHFTLAAERSSPIIPFGSSPGSGTYTVRADAAAHRKGSHFIFRASKQTPDTLQVTQF
jgi:Putative Ig domain